MARPVTVSQDGNSLADLERLYPFICCRNIWAKDTAGDCLRRRSQNWRCLVIRTSFCGCLLKISAPGNFMKSVVLHPPNMSWTMRSAGRCCRRCSIIVQIKQTGKHKRQKEYLERLPDRKTLGKSRGMIRK